MAVRRFVLTPWTNDASARSPALALRGVTRAYGEKLALRDSRCPSHRERSTRCSVRTGPGRPSTAPDAHRAAGTDAGDRADHVARRIAASAGADVQLIGFVPSGDRSFYLRLSGLENLVFFARLHGLRPPRRVAARQRLLDHVGLAASPTPRSALLLARDAEAAVGRSSASSPTPRSCSWTRRRTTSTRRPRRPRSGPWSPSCTRRSRRRLDDATDRRDPAALCHRATLLASGRVDFSGTGLRARWHTPIRRGSSCGWAADRHSEARLSTRISRSARSAARLRGNCRRRFVLTLNDRAVLGEALVRLAEEGVPMLGCHPRALRARGRLRRREQVAGHERPRDRDPAPRRGPRGEIAKLGAFLRRDLLVAWSYRMAFFSDLLTCR